VQPLHNESDIGGSNSTSGAIRSGRVIFSFAVG
jgi:hypothetical protein